MSQTPDPAVAALSRLQLRLKDLEKVAASVETQRSVLASAIEGLAAQMRDVEGEIDAALETLSFQGIDELSQPISSLSGRLIALRGPFTS